MPLSRIENAGVASGAITPIKLANSGRELGPRNRIFNSGMVIDQRNAGAAVTNAAIGYQLDRFLSGYYGSGTGRTTVQQSSVAPTGFVNSLSVTVTTADAAPSGAVAYDLARQPIEGNNISDLAWGTANAQTVTLSFWVRSSVTGNFPFCLGNDAADRWYGALYTISSANTWEYKTIVIPGDTTGTWLTTTGTGMRVTFGGGGGPDRTIATGWATPVGSFQKSNVTGATQLIATLNATWQITGVQLEAGAVATPFERRPFGTELALCQRYYATIPVAGDWATNQFAAFGITFPSPMRAAPTFAVVNAGIVLNLSTINFNTGIDAAYRTNGTSVQGVATTASPARAYFFKTYSITAEL